MIPFRLAPYIIVNLRGGSWFRNLAALSEGWNFVPSEEGINLRTNAPHRRTDAGGVISELRGTLAGDMPADDFGRCRRRDRPRHRTAEQGDELASPHSRRQGGKRFGSSTGSSPRSALFSLANRKSFRGLPSAAARTSARVGRSWPASGHRPQSQNVASITHRRRSPQRIHLAVDHQLISRVLGNLGRSMISPALDARSPSHSASKCPIGCSRSPMRCSNEGRA
jgi:hypothetical protein